MVQVRMGMDDTDQLQTVSIKARDNLLMVAARVDNDGLLGNRVADQGAVALQRADGEGFADQCGICGFHRGSFMIFGTILSH